MFKSKKISNKIILYFITTAIIPLLLVIVTGYIIAHKESTSAIKKHLNNILNTRLYEINSFLNEKRRDIKIMGELAIFAEMTQNMAEGFKQFGLNSKEYNKLSQKYVPILTNYMNTYDYYDVFLISKQGDVVLTVKRESDLGTNLINGPLKESGLAVSSIIAMSNLDTIISDFSFYSPSQLPALFISSPVYHQGNFLGVVAVQLHPKDLYEIFNNSLGLGISGEIFAVKAFHGNALIVTPLRHQSDAVFKKIIKKHNKKTLPLFRSLKGETGQSESIDYRNKDIFIAWKFLASLQLGIVVKMDQEEIFEHINHLRKYMIIIGSFSILIAFILAWVISKAISKPIIRLEKATKNIVSGDLSSRIIVAGHDEISQLGNSFNQMTKKLQSNQEDIATKIRQLNFQKNALDQHAIISISNLEGDIIYINDKFITISGYSREELLGKNHRILNSGEHSKTFFSNMWQTISKGDVWHGVIKNIKKNGDYYWVEATIVPYMDEAGKPIQYIGIRTDITKQKKIEQQLYEEKINAQEAQQIANQANQAKSEFLSAMSHELRTPLNAILGFAQMLDFNPNEPLTLSQKEQVDHITEGGQHLLSLINDILDLAKIESGKLELSMEAVSLSEIIEECLLLISEMAKKRGITISINCAKELNVYADHIRLKQILLNLLSNAVKYNQEKGNIVINTKEKADNQITIAVTDTGLGITKNKQRHLFKPFSRLGNENSSIEGTGIGLSLCKEMVQQMGGSIGLESIGGQGSTFWIKLKQSNEQTLSSNDIDKIKQDNKLDNISGTLLYVEDNPQNIKLIELFSSHIKGLKLIIAKTGEDGLELAKNRQPDMILLDINLPGISGIEVLNLLKSNENTCNIPVYALSAAVTKLGIKKGMDAGFLNYLSKPLQLNELTTMLKSVLGKKDERIDKH